MTSGKERPSTMVVKSPEEMRLKLKQYLCVTLEPLLKYNGIISIGVSGGSMPKLLCEVFKSMERLDWQRIRIFMVDERLVPPTDRECTFAQYVTLLPPHIRNSVIQLQLQENPSRTAAHYELLLKQEAQPEMMGKIPRFDILFLGMGPDGHTCSLFPGHKLMKAELLPWMLWIDDSPKPPNLRVTVNLHVLNAAKNVVFIVTGEEKAGVVKSVLDRDPAYPSSHVRPMNGHLKFFLDEGAASKL